MLTSQEKITNQESKIQHPISLLKTNSEDRGIANYLAEYGKKTQSKHHQKLNLNSSSRDLLFYSLQNSSHSIVLES